MTSLILWAALGNLPTAAPTRDLPTGPTTVAVADGQGGPPDDDAPARLMIGLMFRGGGLPLLARGEGTKDRPLVVAVRLVPFVYLRLEYIDPTAD